MVSSKRKQTTKWDRKKKITKKNSSNISKYVLYVLVLWFCDVETPCHAYNWKCISFDFIHLWPCQKCIYIKWSQFANCKISLHSQYHRDMWEMWNVERNNNYEKCALHKVIINGCECVKWGWFKWFMQFSTVFMTSGVFSSSSLLFDWNKEKEEKKTNK